MPTRHCRSTSSLCLLLVLGSPLVCLAQAADALGSSLAELSATAVIENSDANGDGLIEPSVIPERVSDHLPSANAAAPTDVARSAQCLSWQILIRIGMSNEPGSLADSIPSRSRRGQLQNFHC